MYNIGKFKIDIGIVQNDYKLNNLYIIGQCFKRDITKGKNQLARRSKRLLRTQKFIYQELIKGRKVYFSTFTFSEQYLPFNRKKFSEYLKRTCKINYCLFCDYGEKTNRFHLHGFISTNESLFENRFNKFGFTKFTQVSPYSKSFKRAIKYMLDYSNKRFYDFTLMVGQSYSCGVKPFSLSTLLDIHDMIF